ncbi:hypothetical protein [Streptomyces sp. NRRL S-37]|nr:hypothetical protein [Streptomyces sp. NRRL S-37]
MTRTWPASRRSCGITVTMHGRYFLQPPGLSGGPRLPRGKDVTDE